MISVRSPLQEYGLSRTAKGSKKASALVRQEQRLANLQWTLSVMHTREKEDAHVVCPPAPGPMKPPNQGGGLTLETIRQGKNAHFKELQEGRNSRYLCSHVLLCEEYNCTEYMCVACAYYPETMSETPNLAKTNPDKPPRPSSTASGVRPHGASSPKQYKQSQGSDTPPETQSHEEGARPGWARTDPPGLRGKRHRPPPVVQ